jgi:hypothetical protein
MLGLGKTVTVRASGTANSGRSQDMYQSYAAALYRQALLTPDDSALAEHVVCAPVVNEYALAAMRGRGEGHRRDMAALLRGVLRKPATSPAAVQDGDQV